MIEASLVSLKNLQLKETRVGTNVMENKNNKIAGTFYGIRDFPQAIYHHQTFRKVLFIIWMVP